MTKREKIFLKTERNQKNTFKKKEQISAKQFSSTEKDDSSITAFQVKGTRGSAPYL